MRKMTRALLGLLLAGAIALTTATRVHADAHADVDEMLRMPWVNNREIMLAESNGKIAIPHDYRAISGKDANRFSELVNGKPDDPSEGPSPEAVAVTRCGDTVYFEYSDSGYVDDSDFDSLNPATLLQSISTATEDGNRARRARGLPEIHVVKWLQQPVQDKSTHTFYWALEAKDSTGYLVNSIALRLGRRGFEKLTAVGGLADYRPLGGPLDVMLRAFSFPAGATYEDHISTDKAAGYGIATLIGIVIGAKVVKVAAAGGLALFFKPILVFCAAFIGKLWVLLLAPFVWIRSLFRRRKDTGSSTIHRLPG
jgi:uncharacterized membrane-anchored protein